MKWTPRQTQILKDRFEKVSWTEIRGLFPDFDKKEILRKARSLGLSRLDSMMTGSTYSRYALCHRDGWIPLRNVIIQTNGISTCPKCGRRLRVSPRQSKYKGKGI